MFINWVSSWAYCRSHYYLNAVTDQTDSLQLIDSDM